MQSCRLYWTVCNPSLLCQVTHRTSPTRPLPLPPPRPGQTIDIPFPPPTAMPPPAVAVGAVEVLRYAPEGDVPLAPNLSVTFNQPMVALTSLGDLAAQGVPVMLSPQPAGKWRWIGTKTLAFEPLATAASGTARFPMATQYTVEIPAGTASVSGGKLANAVTWTFTTPPPQIRASSPNDGPHPLDPVMFVAFDQGVDPAAVLKTIEVKAKAEAEERTVEVRLATADEVQADQAVKRLANDCGCRALVGLPRRGAAAAGRVCLRHDRSRHALSRGPADHPGSPGLLVPDLRPAQHRQKLLRVGQRVPADDAVVRRIQQPAG